MDDSRKCRPPHVEHRKGMVETSTGYAELPCKSWSQRSPDPSGSRVSGLSGMLVPAGMDCLELVVPLELLAQR